MIGEVEFLRKIQRILEEGDFVATDKYALLQSLADISIESEPDGNGELPVPLQRIGEKFVEYYWRQARPYRAGAVLKQNTGRQAAVINRVMEAHGRYEVSLSTAKRDTASWSALTRDVAGTVKKMPLWKLQWVGDQEDEFLYRKGRFDGRTIILEPGIAACFRNFYGFIVTLVRSAWIEQILKIRSNRDLLGEQGDLAEFLFGTQRQPLGEYRRILRDHQQARCFYCHKPVRGEGVLDHFIPWVRYPIDLGHNFVFADGHCNASKRDHLAATDHLAHWREQNVDAGTDLEQRFEHAQLHHDRERSLQICSWAYEQAELGESRVWVGGNHFTTLRADWRRLLAA